MGSQPDQHMLISIHANDQRRLRELQSGPNETPGFARRLESTRSRQGWRIL
jgi:hypothetical protein